MSTHTQPLSQSIKRQLFEGKDAVKLSLNVRRTLLWLVYASHQAMEDSPTAIVYKKNIGLRGHLHEAPVGTGTEKAYRFTFCGTIAGDAVEFSITLSRKLFRLTWDEYVWMIQNWRPGIALLTPDELVRN
jgi:hypothetical protein